MSDFLERISNLSPKRLMLLAMELKSKLEASEALRPEPIAIIGLGCRFPGGADGPEAYWKLLREGRDAIREVPADRWDIDTYYDPNPDCPGKMITRWGGFLDHVDQFEPQFFGLAPREAASMDPQQRLLLEVAWEALEHSGHAPDSFGKSQTGVFVGMCSNDYYQMLMESPSGASNTYLATGNAHSIASGRISYVLGLQGPSMTIDTACSASLVAVHLACKSLNNSECRMALAGGVNAILWPQTTVALSAARMMAPDGRCKTFDAKADGFVRGEGCGIVVLKRLSDAVGDGDRVLAVIPGTAINQDGRSSGLTAPNGPSQTAVIQEALNRANVDPLEVSYVEAHGTGTSLGDPIEVQALAAALCAGRPTDRPLLIGSVKTNIGHLEAAAGIASLIKVVLSLEHNRIPAHLHLQNLNPHVGWSEMPVRVTSESQPWPAASRRIAGISSFGFSGTNAHMIVAEAPSGANQSESCTARPMELCCLSAGSAKALSEQASRLAVHIESNPDLGLADICSTLNVGRAHLAHRAALTAVTVNELRTKLADMAEGRSVAGMKSGVVAGKDNPAIAFLFTGQGSQYAGMGSELYRNEPAFQRAMDRCAELFAEISPDDSLLSVVFGENSALLNQTEFTQPALFAIEYALAEMWISYGIRPSYVMGHSVGEYVAACTAGVMSLEAALKLVAMRGRLMQALPAGGGMAAILAPRETVESVLTTYTASLSIAAVNGPENIVISGKAEPLESAIADFEGQGIRVQRLNVSHAFHSNLLDSVLDEFESFANKFEYQAPRIGLVSNLSGSLFDGRETPNAFYWRRHAREAVNFEAGMRALHEQGCRIFVEIGPSPILIGMGKQCIPDAATTWAPSLRKGNADWSQILAGLGELYVRSARIDWSGFYHGQQRRRLALPTYPFERRRCWIDDAERVRQGTAKVTQKNDRVGNALLGQPLESARGETVYSTRLSLESHPFLHTAHAAIDQCFYEIEWMQADLKQTTIEATDLPSAVHLAKGTSELGDILATGPEIASTRLTKNPDIAGHRATSRWVILGEGGGIGDLLASLTANAGIACIRVMPGPQFTHSDKDSFTIDPEKPADFDRLLIELPVDKNVRTEFVHLLGYDACSSDEPGVESIDREITSSCRSALYLTQALVRAEQNLRSRLWIVTRAAQPVGEELTGLRAGQSVVWGLGRTVANEHPEIWGGLIDADFGHAERNAVLIADELEKQSDEDQIAYRNGTRYVARLHRVARKSPGELPILPSDRTYLVTGGTGGIGMNVAKWLVEKGARRIVLTGRSGISRVKPEEQQALEALGASVVVRTVDVSNEDQMRNLFAEIANTMPRLAGVFHLAGVFDDRVLTRHDWTRFERVLSPKARGGWILHELTKGLQLDFFVLFSSGASFLAPAGVANYSAANSFLDALAHHRRSIGLPATSINWGPWERVGMAGAVGERSEGQWAQAGLDTMAPGQGLAAMERLIIDRAPQTAVLIVDWVKYAERFRNAVLPLYQDLCQADGKSPRNVPHPVSILHALERALPTEQRELLTDHLRENIIEVLGFDRGYQLDADQELFDLGMDSLTAVELKNRLQLSFRTTLPSTLLFDHPSLRNLSDYIAERLKASSTDLRGDGSGSARDRTTDSGTSGAADVVLEFEEGVL